MTKLRTNSKSKDNSPAFKKGFLGKILKDYEL